MCSSTFYSRSLPDKLLRDQIESCVSKPIKLMAREDVDMNAEDANGATSLLSAAENGHETVVELLLSCDNIDVNMKDINGTTPLSSAAANGKEEVVSCSHGMMLT